MVKDDVPMLLDNIEYHRSIGVDNFLICDRGSTPESMAAIQALVDESNDIVLFKQHLYEIEDKSNLDMVKERAKPFRIAVEEFNADWLYVSDTDEFLVSSTGSIKTALVQEKGGHLFIPRFNTALSIGEYHDVFEGVRSGSGLMDQEVIVDRVKLSRQAMQESPEVPWVMHAIDPKFITTVKEAEKVLPGFHDISAKEKVEKCMSTQLAMCHFPFTSLDRFVLKVAAMRNHLRHLESKIGKHHGWHWKRWVDELRTDADIEMEYEKQFFDDAKKLAMRQSGQIKKLRDYFSSGD